MEKNVYYRLCYIRYQCDERISEIHFSSKYLIECTDERINIQCNQKYCNMIVSSNLTDAVLFVGQNGSGKTSLCRDFLSVISYIQDHTTFDGKEIIFLFEKCIEGKDNGKLFIYNNSKKSIKLFGDNKLLYAIAGLKEVQEMIDCMSFSYFSEQLSQNDYLDNIYSDSIQNLSLGANLAKSRHDPYTKRDIFNDSIIEYFNQKKVDVLSFVLKDNIIDNIPFGFPSKITVQIKNYKEIISAIESNIKGKKVNKEGQDILYNAVKESQNNWSVFWEISTSSTCIQLVLNICLSIYVDVVMGWYTDSHIKNKTDMEIDQENIGIYLAEILNGINNGTIKKYYQVESGNYNSQAEKNVGLVLIRLFSDGLKRVIDQKVCHVLTKNSLTNFYQYIQFLNNSMAFFDVGESICISNLKGKPDFGDINVYEYRKNVLLFVEFVRKFETFYSFLSIEYGLSAGEFNYICLFQKIDSEICRIQNKDDHIQNSMLLILDEPDISMHPEWQRRFMNIILNSFNKYTNMHFQLMITTHSPIILSDFSRDNVYCITQEKEVTSSGVDEIHRVIRQMPIETFGNNVHTLLADSFFLKDGTIGEYSKIFINRLASEIIDECIDYDNIEVKINTIGNPIIRDRLHMIFNARKNKHDKNRFET